MYCQKCRTPLKLDGSLESLNPAAFELLVSKLIFTRRAACGWILTQLQTQQARRFRNTAPYLHLHELPTLRSDANSTNEPLEMLRRRFTGGPYRPRGRVASRTRRVCRKAIVETCPL